MFRKCADLVVLAVIAAILGSLLVGSTQGRILSNQFGFERNGFRRERKTAPRKPAPFVHTVIFFLKKDAPANEADSVIGDTQKLLAKIPSVREIRAGRPAEKTSPVAVKDYQVGLLVLFDDVDGLHAYSDHPLHKEFVANHEKHFEKVAVYDFLAQNPGFSSSEPVAPGKD
jgi:hypothetical protein